MSRETGPTAAVIDSQCVKGSEKGKKCHVFVYTVGLLLHALIHPKPFCSSKFKPFRRTDPSASQNAITEWNAVAHQLT